MPVKTYYFLSTRNANLTGDLQEDGTAPANATTGTGWVVAKSTSVASDMEAGVKRLNSTFTNPVGTTVPNGFAVTKGFVTPTALTGDFAAGDWLIYQNWITTVGTVHDGYPACRIYRADSLTGTNFTAVSSSTAAPQVNDFGLTAKGTLVTINLSAFSLANKYLFFLFGWNAIGSGGNNSADLLLRIGTENSGCKIVTPNFVQSLSASGSVGTINVVAPTGSATISQFEQYQLKMLGVGK